MRGVQLFDGGMGVPLVVPEPVRPGSPAWQEAVSTAVSTAADLGLELAVATSSGWSAAGGPWVEPADAMKKLVWSETIVPGGDLCEVELTPLPEVAGPFQDSRRWGSADGSSWSTDWRVVAVPYIAAHDPLIPAAVEGSAPVRDWTALVDDGFQASIALPRDPDDFSSASLTEEFASPVTVRSVTLGLPGPRGFGAAPAPHAVLQASEDGTLYRDVAQLPPTSVPVRSATFPAVTARWFRLVLSGAAAADALPPVAEGVRLPPVLRRSDTFLVSEFALRSAARVHRSEVKSGFGVIPDYYAADTMETTHNGVIPQTDVHDLTRRVQDGRLDWDAPPGRWRILRFGASLTGQTNGPALPDSTGLEVDKLDGRRVAAYLQRHLAEFGVESGFGALLSDSIESGAQNWTDAIAERFRELRGYDPTPWLPALAGFVIEDAAASDRFLYDYRRTITELFAREYYGTLAGEAHRRGMVYYAEALEDGRPQLGDDLGMRAHADVPMGAMWTFDSASGPRPTYVADLKGASSVAHVHGRAWTGAEAFTSFDRPWASSPRSLKHVADLQLALGVTRFCIHTSPHQPLAAPPPGVALAPFLGQAFTINETWAEMAHPWIDYLARCSAMLSAGEPAVDVAVFVGEEAPVTGLFDERFDTCVPMGFDFDYVGADGLSLLTVEDGELRSLGARYRLLYLGGSSRRTTVAALRRIEKLLDDGATVVGLRPECSPSLADDNGDFAAVCDRIWARPRAFGRIVPTSDLDVALRELGVRSAFEISGAELWSIARLVDGRRVTFLANPAGEDVSAQVTVPPEVGPLTGWDPVELRTTALTEIPATAGGISFEIHLPAFGSLFVLPDASKHAEDAASLRSVAVEVAGGWSLAMPGRGEIELPGGPMHWTELDTEARGFSGTAVYRAEFVLESVDDGDRFTLSLGSVRDIARVLVNGIDCGVAWTPPFRCDVTAAARGGINALEVHVATPWRNRLIAEAKTASGAIFAPMTQVFEPDAEPLVAGLGGPVLVLVTSGS
ncbi:hypothetical protein GCM10009777_13610 [Microbacterium pumilum]|uniref:Glycoside hydrolase n=1 Tax=Microbacterium pumilum TaxID=344165 RepID=A0ABP5DKY0_9MICO